MGPGVDPRRPGRLTPPPPTRPNGVRGVPGFEPEPLRSGTRGLRLSVVPFQDTLRLSSRSSRRVLSDTIVDVVSGLGAECDVWLRVKCLLSRPTDVPRRPGMLRKDY